MRIVSLLPSATEIVFALGLEEQLEGVTFECDFPPAARDLPWVSDTALTGGPGATPEQIDTEVRARMAAGDPISTLDRERIRTIAPDLILTQDLCRVCAVPSGDVHEALDSIGCHADVVSLDPHRLDEVIAGVGLVADAVGVPESGARVMADLRARVETVRRRVADLPRPRVLVLEWADPPFNAGHWVPDMIEAAGGIALLAEAGARSVTLTWEEIGQAPVDVVVFSPCGFDVDAAIEQAAAVLPRPELAQVERFFAVDANAFFSRPGPRVVDGVEQLAQLLHPTGPGPVDLTGAVQLR